MERPILAPGFEKDLRAKGYFVDDMLSSPGNPAKVIYQWTGLRNKQIKEGMYNDQKDKLQPLIQKSVEDILQPWITTKTDEGLPSIAIEEVTRATGISETQVLSVISKYPVSVSINGSSFVSAVQMPEIPKGATLSDASGLGISPKRVSRLAGYVSRPAGGGPIQRSRFQKNRVERVLAEEARKKTKITLGPVLPNSSQTSNEKFRVMKEKSKPLETMFYAEPNGNEIRSVYRWFENAGGRNWMLGKERIFAERLVQLARGEEVDFLIWNCFGFTWKQGENGEYPTTKLIDNLDNAITYYFRDRITEMIAKLSRIGTPQITILVPSNEVHSDDLGIWKYEQSIQERESLMASIVGNFSQITDLIKVPEGRNLIQVMQWDEYLSRASASDQNAYTLAGISAIRNVANTADRERKMLQNAKDFFASLGIQVTPNQELIERQTNYLGMYVGEGVASAGNRIGNRDIVWVNFEESTIKKAEFIGADGDIAIVTPVNDIEISGYYRWKKEVIKNRKKD